MIAFNFHHHFPENSGIYNLNLNGEKSLEKFSAGIHPKDINKNIEAALNWLNLIAVDENCVAIGECGLDGLIDINEELQKKVFKRQIDLANDLQKPLIIHCVKKFHELPSFKKMSNVQMVIHGFNKRKNIGESLLEDGFYISFGTSILHNVNLQAFFKEMPSDKFFLETDAAETDINEIYEIAADLKKLSLEDLGTQIKTNLQHIGITL